MIAFLHKLPSAILLVFSFNWRENLVDVKLYFQSLAHRLLLGVPKFLSLGITHMVSSLVNSKMIGILLKFN